MAFRLPSTSRTSIPSPNARLVFFFSLLLVYRYLACHVSKPKMTRMLDTFLAGDWGQQVCYCKHACHNWAGAVEYIFHKEGRKGGGEQRVAKDVGSMFERHFFAFN